MAYKTSLSPGRVRRVEAALLAVAGTICALSACDAKSSHSSASETSVTAKVASVDTQPFGIDKNHLAGARVLKTEDRAGHLFVTAHVFNSGAYATDIESSSFPPKAVAADGTTLEGPIKALPLNAYSSVDATFEFDGTFRESQNFTLHLGSYGPNIDIADVAFVKGGAKTFVEVPAASANVSDGITYHAGGVSLIVYTISKLPNGAAVSFKAINGSDTVRNLFGSVNDPPLLQDDSGATLIGMPTADNSDLKVAAFGRTTGTIYFQGQFGSSAHQATLRMNSQLGGTSEYDTTPALTITNLPIPSAS